ncbi:MAG TPA: hypothetical protein VK767_09990 [Bradyrhizobium sp.]|jgi:hypothetical protein|nr:hypothetical protein [Bradyrhizobium sp.]
MTKRRFGRQLALGAIIAGVMAVPAAWAQQDEPAPAVDNKPGTLIKAGDVLSGELNSLRGHGDKKGKRSATYQLTSQPHRLPPPGGLCGLETGPETFQIVTNNDAQATQLKSFVGKAISLRVDEIACAEDAGQMSEAVISKWSVVTKH